MSCNGTIVLHTFGALHCASQRADADRSLGELELELIQSHMAQKPVLRVKWGARVLRVRSVSRGEVWASAGVQGAWVGWVWV